ncbi:phospholipase D-like domain-containing protein [Sphingomonas sp. LB-2]|uniref:phospholipase D-like domain-containing protein n=1 Tax=Sphingomonas caeni TaxID=2984949 RepID=UPI002230670C|nr:phospholipase D-like domain-containing protein [Sphingomonas caeni]MCW3845646.1 phospholipase D-like domain-containing protein [Sphingomonas caeni]
MPAVSARNGSLTVKAYSGDAKTLLAFNLETSASRRRLAGFTVLIAPPGVPAYYMQNDLKFEHPEKHAQDSFESPFATINAPIHKFRWLHVPGAIHQGGAPVFGTYRYSVTPRYFDANQALLPIDPALTAAVDVEVGPFVRGRLKLGFTRGFVQSQAFVRHFGDKMVIQKRGAELLFDTGEIAGSNAKGESYSFAQEYAWLGFTARERIFELVQQVLDDPALTLDLFAYDLREPDFMKALIALGKQGRARIILDDAALHHNKTEPEAEDEFEALFAKAATGAAAIKRGHFGRYSHDKIIIIRDKAAPHTAHRVLTGSTNFAITGFYVNSNHVLVFEDPGVAALYARLFDESWGSDCDPGRFIASALGTGRFEFSGQGLPDFSVTFSPHSPKFAGEVLQAVIDRIAAEENAEAGRGSVLFAVMELGGPIKPGSTPAVIAKKKKDNPVYAAINALHGRQKVFSYGISDNPEGISLYPVGSTEGVIVTGKPGKTRLPPPFSQVPGIGMGHQVHHKFVVCGFNGPDPVTVCGSSNLALGGEGANGDNLLVIRDEDVATAFAIEALALVDHFNFLNNLAEKKAAAGEPQAPGAPSAALAEPRRDAATAAGWFLGTTDAWSKKFFDPKDLHCMDRVLFAV